MPEVSLKDALSEIVFSCRVLSQGRDATIAEIEGFLSGPLATAVARARREALEEADNREVERILGLSDAEVSAEIEAEGRDPEALTEAMCGQMNATFRLCEEIKTLREALAPFAAILANGEPVGPIPRGLLDSKITRQDLRRATAALAAAPPEARQTETGWKPPAGWKLVPVEPTEQMDAAARIMCHQMSGVIDPVVHVWDAMLAASPPPPAIGNLEGEGRS